jgi:hypothetical protein
MDRTMSSIDALHAALAPVLELVASIDPAAPDAAASLAERLPIDGPVLVTLGAALRAAVAEAAVADREAGGVRFSRLKKAANEGELSVDVVHMSSPGPGHTHPNGEVDLCFAVSGEPRFDGRAPGWTVYPPGSWHVPTVEGGAMDILYFLPGGAIRFEAKPS